MDRLPTMGKNMLFRGSVRSSACLSGAARMHASYPCPTRRDTLLVSKFADHVNVVCMVGRAPRRSNFGGGGNAESSALFPIPSNRHQRQTDETTADLSSLSLYPWVDGCRLSKRGTGTERYESSFHGLSQAESRLCFLQVNP